MNMQAVLLSIVAALVLPGGGAYADALKISQMEQDIRELKREVERQSRRIENLESELARSRALARINRLKRLQDALGQIHDFEILIEHTREVQAALAGTDRTAATDLDRLIRMLEAQCREGHAAFVRDRASLQALCQQIIDAARQGRPTFM